LASGASCSIDYLGSKFQSFGINRLELVSRRGIEPTGTPKRSPQSDFPRVLFLVSFAVLWLSSKIGVSLHKWFDGREQGEGQDFNVVLTATLTLLGLIIGFSFSMAIGRYDQRKNYEAIEANVIGTEYARADLLGPSDAERTQDLLKKYLAQRVLFYMVRDSRQLGQVNRQTAQLQQEMWSVVEVAATAKPSPVKTLVASGMNEVLDSAGYTQAAWWNRIPVSAWSLMAIIAVCSSVMIGYGSDRKHTFLLTVLPFVFSVAFLLIADIDSPRRGLIQVRPENLIRLSESLSAH
jgi:hypothetical protein